MNVKEADLLFVNIATEDGEPVVSALRKVQVAAHSHYAASAEAALDLIGSIKPSIILASTSDLAEGASLPQFLRAATATTELIVTAHHPDLPKTAIVVHDFQPSAVASACCALVELIQARVLKESFERENEQLRRDLSALRASEGIAEAITVDGVIVDCTDQFAASMGYQDTAALEAMPLLDIVHADDRGRVRLALAAFRRSETPASIDAQLIHQEEASPLVCLDLSATEYDGEAGVRIALKAVAAASRSALQSMDLATGFETSGPFTMRLREYLECAQTAATLVYVGVDQYEKLIASQGLSGGLALMQGVAALIREAMPKAFFGRVCDEGIAGLLPAVTVADALITAENLCKAISEARFDVNGEARAATVSIGIVNVESSYGIDPWVLFDQAQVACKDVRALSGQSGVGNGAAIFARQARRVEALAAAAGPRDINAEVHDLLENGDPQITWQPVVSLLGEKTEALFQADVVDNEFVSCGRDWIARIESETQETTFDRWLLKTALAAVKAQRSEPSAQLLFDVSVNLLRDSGFARWLGVVLTAANVSASSLTLLFRAASVAGCINEMKAFVASAKSEGLNGLKIGLREFSGNSLEQQVLAELAIDVVRFDARFVERNSQGDSAAFEELSTAVVSIRGDDEKGAQKAKIMLPGVDSASLMAKLCQLRPDYIFGHYIQPPELEMNYNFEGI